MALVTDPTNDGSNTTNTKLQPRPSAEFNLFLKLLTTQMKNQNPLSPTDSAQYTQQLVQYSLVEQSIQQNKSLSAMLATMTVQSLSQNSTLIGQMVEVNSDKAALSANKPAQWNWKADGPVDKITISIIDGKGKTVEKREVTVSGTEGTFSWDGSTSSGTKLTDGLYQVVIEGTNSAGAKIKVTPSATGVVENVQMINGVPTLTINGAQYPNKLITRIGK